MCVFWEIWESGNSCGTWRARSDIRYTRDSVHVFMTTCLFDDCVISFSLSITAAIKPCKLVEWVTYCVYATKMIGWDTDHTNQVSQLFKKKLSMTSYHGHPRSISHTFAHVITYTCPLYKKKKVEKNISLWWFFPPVYSEIKTDRPKTQLNCVI